MNAFNPFELLALGLLLIIWVTLTRIERRLREHEIRLDLLLRHAGIDPSKPAEPSERVKVLAQQPSQRIEAIKTYRRETGADLRSAKAMVESLQKSTGRRDAGFTAREK
jgi:ribosomal protein L7/L12